MLLRINRYATIADFKMQFYAVGIAVANFGYFLQARYRLALFDHNFFGVGVGRKVVSGMAHDHQFAVATQAGTSVDDFASSGSTDGFA